MKQPSPEILAVFCKALDYSITTGETLPQFKARLEETIRRQQCHSNTMLQWLDDTQSQLMELFNLRPAAIADLAIFDRDDYPDRDALKRLLEDAKQADVTGEQTVALRQLVSIWGKTAKVALRDAAQETDPNAKRAIEGKGMCYWNCATELNTLIETGNLPSYFSLQIRQQDAE